VKKSQFLIGVVVALLVGVGVTIAFCGSGSPEQWNITCEDDLLQKLGKSSGAWCAAAVRNEVQRRFFGRGVYAERSRCAPSE
jgi:hypothetical protein